MLFYDRYFCYSSKITVTIMQNNTTLPVIFWLYPFQFAAPPFVGSTSYRSLAEAPYIRWKTVMPRGGGDSIKTVTNYMTTRKMYQVKDLRDNFIYAGSSSAEPPQQWYWHLFFTDPVGSQPGLVVDCWYRVTIDYYCELTGRKAPAIE